MNESLCNYEEILKTVFGRNKTYSKSYSQKFRLSIRNRLTCSIQLKGFFQHSYDVIRYVAGNITSNTLLVLLSSVGSMKLFDQHGRIFVIGECRMVFCWFVNISKLKSICSIETNHLQSFAIPTELSMALTRQTSQSKAVSYWISIHIYFYHIKVKATSQYCV